MTSFVQTVPINIDADGVWRVGKTRVTVDTIVAAFNEGVEAEQIARQYDSIKLADIYAVIAFYLNHRREVEIYLEKQAEIAAAVRRENEARFPPDGIRERLLARKNGAA